MTSHENYTPLMKGQKPCRHAHRHVLLGEECDKQLLESQHCLSGSPMEADTALPIPPKPSMMTAREKRLGFRLRPPDRKPSVPLTAVTIGFTSRLYKYQMKLPYVKYYFSDGPRARKKMFSRIPRKASVFIIKYGL